MGTSQQPAVQIMRHRLPLIVLLFLFVSPAVTKESSTWGQIIFGSPAQGTCKIITTYEVPILNCHCATNMTLKGLLSSMRSMMLRNES